MPGEARESPDEPPCVRYQWHFAGRECRSSHYSGCGDRNASVATEGGDDRSGQGEQPSTLDEAQEFAAASSYQVRDELVELIERDLLGPWDGELEVLPPRSAGPGERYLVGRLGPRHDPHSKTDAAGDTVDTEISAGGDGADGELPELLTMQNAGRMWASSMGLSCVVASGVDTLTVTTAWGRYGKAEVLDDAGNPRRSWSREPTQYVRHVRFGDGPSQRIPLTMPDIGYPGCTWPWISGRA